jgi:glycine/D-amino acid oxidase-like deaminating enzyme
MRAKVVVIGGGVMGTSIAMHLARRLDPIEEPLVLFEKSARLAAGSSGRSGAILRQHYAEPAVARMARSSLEEYASFERRTGRSLGFRRTGVLTLAGPGPWADRVRANVAMLRRIGVDTHLVDATEIRRLVRGIDVADTTVGAWEPGGGFVDPVTTVEAFAALGRTHGVNTRLGVAAEGIEAEGGRVVGVRTSDGIVEAEQVVVVAGPWTPGLLARSGIEVPLRAIRPEQHFVELAPVPLIPAARREPDLEDLLEDDLDGPLARVEREARERESREVVPHPSLIDLEHGFYTRCEPGAARTRIGRIDYTHDVVLADPDQLDEDVSAEFRAWARQKLVERLPLYASLADLDSEAAWYTLSPDAQALLGELPALRGLFIASGFSGHGFKLAPSVGAGMTQLLMGEPVTAFDPTFFSPSRFDRGVDRGVEWGGGAFGL